MLKNRAYLLAALLFLVALELLSAKIRGQIAGFTGVLWVAQYLVIVGITIFFFFRVIGKEFIEKNYETVGCILALFTLLLITPFLTSFIGMNYEAALQVAEGLRGFSSQDLNYHGLAFLGYGARQYLLASLPTLLFGKSVVALSFGFFHILIVGWMAFVTGLLIWTKRNELPSHLTLIPAAAIIFLPMFADNYLNFEQILMPSAVALLLAGWLLIAQDEKSDLSLFALFFISCLAYYSYTPALSLLALMLAFAVLALFDKRIEKSRKLDLIIIASCILLFLLLPRIYTEGRGDRALSQSEILFSFERALLSLKWAFFGVNGYNPLNGNFGILIAPILCFLLLSIAGKIGKYNFLFALWAICVYVMAVAYKGYAGYEGAYALSFRTQHVTVLMLLFSYVFLASLLQKYKVKISKSFSISSALILLLIFAYSFYIANNTYWKGPRNQKMKYILDDMVSSVGIRNAEGNFVDAVAYFSGPGMNFYDYGRYYFSDVKVFSVMDYKITPEILECRNVVAYGDASSIELLGNPDLELREKRVKDMRLGETYVYYEINIPKTHRRNGKGCL